MEIPMNQLVSVGASCKKGVPQREHQRCCGPAVRLPEGSEKSPGVCLKMGDIHVIPQEKRQFPWVNLR